ncbi:MAG: malonyl-CoA decarboxylase, partial [bacterium]|nr:malonyl-CoA decarboxylase [bacterium]
MSVPAGEVSSFERIFSNVRSAWAELATKKDEQRLRDQLVACIEGRGGEITARRRAIELGRNYLDLSEAGRRRFLQMLAEFDVDRDAVLQIA